MTSRTKLIAILAALVFGCASAFVLAPAAGAAATVIYVDGKNGSDSNSGTDLARPFQTIAAAANALPAGGEAAGWTIRVVGYPDHIYRERPIPMGWNRHGTSSARITFEAVGYNGSRSGYTMPVVSGADTAPAPGKTWIAHRSGIWKTPWASAPLNLGKLSGGLRTAVFQDTTSWLWERSSLSELETYATSGRGGYWWSDGWLYVAPLDEADPANHSFEVVMRNGFYFYGINDISYVTVRGFEIRHSGNGISFAKGVDGGTAVDNRAIANLLMGFAVSGRQDGNMPDPATGAVIARNEGAYNTLQAVKLDEGTVDATVCDNDFHHNGLMAIVVQGPPGGTGYTGETSGNLICRNALHHQSYNPTGTTYNNASGLTIQNGARSTRAEENRIWSNDVGIHVTQVAVDRPAITGTVLVRNRVWSNRRFGLNLFDGYNGSGSGDLTSSHDLYWRNGIGVMVDRGTSNKTLSHVTIWGNVGDGVKVGGVDVAPANVDMQDSLVTGNGGKGVWVVTGNSASLSHVGLSSNAGGNIYGSPSRTAINNEPAGYLSTDPRDAGFLTISPSSYQYTAGPNSSPIGALWSTGFADIVGSPFEADILWIASRGITTGCAPYRFCPNDSVTRGQMAAFLVRALGLTETTIDFFTDDNGTSFENDINRVAAAGIANGCSATSFCADSYVTRGQMAAFLARARDLPPAGLDSFTDDNGSSFEGDINRLAAAKIAKGCTATMFCPNDRVTRAQMAAFLHRAFE